MNIKYSITFVVLFALNMLDARAQQIDTIVVDDDCRRMVQFFKATLYENYGDSLAFDTFHNAYHAYDGNYILQVDHDKLKILFAEIYERTWQNYFLGGYDERKSKILSKNPKWDLRWVHYSPGLRGITIYPETPGSYLQRVIAKSEVPYFERIYNHAITAREFSGYHVNDYWVTHDWLDSSFRHNNEEVQLWLTFRFWPYLCHCANIDVYYGKPKEEVPDTFITREFAFETKKEKR